MLTMIMFASMLAILFTSVFTISFLATRIIIDRIVEGLPSYYERLRRGNGFWAKVIAFGERLVEVMGKIWKFAKKNCTKENMKKLVENCKATWASFCEKAKEFKEAVKNLLNVLTLRNIRDCYVSFELYCRDRFWELKEATENFINGFESVSVSVINRDSTPESTTKFTFDGKHVEKAVMFLCGFIIFIHLLHIYFTYDGDINTRIDQVSHSVRNLCDCQSDKREPGIFDVIFASFA